MSKPVQVIVYASPDLVPAYLKPVALVAAATDAIVVDVVTQIAGMAAALPDKVTWGAVEYATVDLVPAQLRTIVNGG